MKKLHSTLIILTLILAFAPVVYASDVNMTPATKTIKKPVINQQNSLKKSISVPKIVSGEIQDIIILAVELRPCSQGYKAYVAFQNNSFEDGKLVVSFWNLAHEDDDSGETWKAPNGHRMESFKMSNLLGKHIVRTLQCGSLPETEYIKVFIQHVVGSAGYTKANRTFKVSGVMSNKPAEE